MNKLRMLARVALWMVRHRGNDMEFRDEHDMNGLPCALIACKTILVWDTRDVAIYQGHIYARTQIEVMQVHDERVYEYRYVWVGPATPETFAKINASYCANNEATL